MISGKMKMSNGILPAHHALRGGIYQHLMSTRNCPQENVVVNFTAHNEQRANPHANMVKLEDNAYIVTAWSTGAII